MDPSMARRPKNIPRINHFLTSLLRENEYQQALSIFSGTSIKINSSPLHV
jgi:hypothetical protein